MVNLENFVSTAFHSQFRVCMQKLGVSRPAGLGGDREQTNSSKPKTQIYIYMAKFGKNWQILCKEIW
jgi:hypothetical protein